MLASKEKLKMKKKKVIIIGAGPAGLTAAYELSRDKRLKVIVIEKEKYVGGLSTTLEYKGNKLDIGGHRFFTQSDRVINWWLSFLPLKTKKPFTIKYQGSEKRINPPEIGQDQNRGQMLVRDRISRIYYHGKFYDYPISINIKTVSNLGLGKSFQILFDFAIARILKHDKDKSLEDFFINRFGKHLYHTFFRTYTEKVWGVKCSEIPASWGHQRIKQISLISTIKSSISYMFSQDGKKNDQFLYPTNGPGQLWNIVKESCEENGVEFILDTEVNSLKKTRSKIHSVKISKNKKDVTLKSDYVVSTMPIDKLAKSLTPKAPKNIMQITDNLVYRDFIIVGILIPKSHFIEKLIDNWIYIHDSEVLVGRIQVFNNWSPTMVKDKKYYWVGMEYFCNNGDTLWKSSNKKLLDLAAKELWKLKLIKRKNTYNGKVVKVPKAYPAYHGSYPKMGKVREYFDEIENMYLIGRNGMHRYNNQDHSMLSAMKAAEAIIDNSYDKAEIWEVNENEEYHEK